MVAVSAAACALLVFNFFRPRFSALLVGSGIYVALYVVGILLLPVVFQKFFVQPSELALETPYLKNYIEFTRKAYQLEAIQETSYPALADLTPAVIARNEDTIQNIRLWDSRPLLQTYQQTQAIRLYYQFYNVGVDRYHLADGYHQVMLATRELSPELPAKAQTWVNQYLQFTHGYGVVMNFVSKKVGGGFPQYLLENVPAESAYGLNITQPAIYYGESMPGYRIVATGIKEFDYPKGNDNVYTSYNGKGGIPLDSFWKKLLFAWTQKDVNILLTSYLTPDSRIQIWRTVQERVAQIAPFLRLDTDPYPVLSAGKLYWIQDAYTDSDQFPYSYPHGAGFGDNLNYIRNSVKVVVDMYDGTVSFYVMDPKDPVLAVYRRAFPGVFKDLDQLSADLKKHLRYPEDLFAIQADQYKTFHMTDPQVFYNREDLWVAPKETYAGQSQPMEPYYILMKLPGSDQLEYLLMTPFTPQNRDNMISWMAARCDFPEYGKMLFYQLPKEKLIYGPNQIEAMIDQNTTISQQLTLWDQRGSRVIRGKLIVTPIENSFLYIVPLYLQAEGTNFPQLKRVIAVAGDKVVMEPTLDEAVNDLFGTQQPLQGIVAAAHPRSRPWSRRECSSRRPGRQCSRGTGQNSERRWRASSTSWPGRRHDKIHLFNAEGSRAGGRSHKLRELACWYRESVERTGNPTIWDARLRIAEDLEVEAARISELFSGRSMTTAPANQGTKRRYFGAAPPADRSSVSCDAGGDRDGALESEVESIPNPLHWTRQHQLVWVGMCVLGAFFGIFIGFLHTPFPSYREHGRCSCCGYRPQFILGCWLVDRVLSLLDLFSRCANFLYFKLGHSPDNRVAGELLTARAVVEMTGSASVSWPEFDELLFAPDLRGKEWHAARNVLSALARLGIDPWQEATD